MSSTRQPTERADAEHEVAPGPEPTRPRLVISGYAFAPDDVARLRSALGADRFIQASSADTLHQALQAHPEADVVCTMRPPADLLEVAPGLRWLQLASAGVEHAVRVGVVRDSGPVVTNASGIHGAPISEFVLSMMLFWARKWRPILALQDEHEWPNHQDWEALEGTELNGRTLGIIGLGAIGSAIARLGHALGMRVLATKRTVHPGDTSDEVDALLPAERIDDLLAQSDYVVLATPLTSQTAHMIDARRLAKMRPSAVLINIARGQLINEADLIHALVSGTIAGAALDVFEVEPLPETSPLWSLPNVIISPHISGATDRYSSRLATLFLDNLARYRAGQPLRNVVDPARGY